MTDFEKYQQTTEKVKDSISEQNRILQRKLAEAQQSFELLKFVHFEKSINLQTLNDIIVGCTGCLYSIIFYNNELLTNLKSSTYEYGIIKDNKSFFTDLKELFISDTMIKGYTTVAYPISQSELILDRPFVDSVLLLYPTKFVTDEVIAFFKSFMIVNEVLINIVLTREKLFNLIETDPLTGLLNRNSWRKVLNEHTISCPYFVIFADIDNFKFINDTYGHQVGDEVLKDSADWLRGMFKRDGKIFRLGGDEFAVVGLIDPNSVCTFYSRLNLLNADYMNYIKNKHNFEVTISIGGLIVIEPMDLDDIYSSADKMLYKSKDSGKNTVNIFNKSEMDMICKI